MTSLPDSARVVVVGGGAVGCSIAYHLAKLGVAEVLLLERRQLTSGCTWHAAGLVGQLRSKTNLTRMMQYSARLYATIGAETGQDVGWHGTGSLRLAASRERFQELRRSATTARGFGFELHVLSPAEAFDRFPLLDPDGVVGATFVPGDGYVDPYSLTQAYAAGARRGGVRIVEGVVVTGVITEKRRIVALETDHGRIRCETVVNAAGLWARHFGELCGLELPVTVVEHQYLVTEKTERVPAGLPSLRDPDLNFYLKPEPGALAIGGWEPDTLPALGTGQIPLDFGQQLFPENFDRFEQIMLPAARRVPILNELGIRSLINGPIPISADGEPVIGPAPQFDNLFLACGFTSGIAGSGGAGKVVADWIVHGDPGMDLWSFDVRRFGAHHGSSRYLTEVGVESYGAYYHISWPTDERQAARGLRRSPLHPALAAAGAVFGSRNGWERPNWFRRPGVPDPDERTFDRLAWRDTVGAEHRLIREGVALIDQTSFTKLEVSGPGALALLDRLAANRIDRPTGSVVYTQLCNERGGIEADLTIARLAPDRFYVITGSAFGIHDGGWITRHMPADGSVVLTEVTSAYAVINLCGPLARAVLAASTGVDVGNAALAYMTMRELRLGVAPVRALRVTYVGELGYELHVPTEYAPYVFERLLDAGIPHGIGHAGYRAIDSARIEKRYLYWSSDVSPDVNPYEAGLGFAVALDKGDFIGRDALVGVRRDGPTQRLVCLALAQPLPVYGGEAIWHSGQVVGTATSGNYGFTVGRSIVLGYVPATLATGQGFAVEAFGETTPAERIDGCAYDPRGSRVRG